MTTNETAALAVLARQISEAFGRFADTIEAPAEIEPELITAEPTQTEEYYLRQAKVLQALVEKGGSVTLSDFRLIARNAGYKRSAQQYWRPNGLCQRKGESISITPKGRARLKFAQNYTSHLKAA